MNKSIYHILVYIIEVSVILGVLGILFHFFFRKLTFYYINRVLLLLIVLCSFVIPALKVDLHQQNPFVQAVLLPIDNGERIATPIPTLAHYDGTNDQVSSHSPLPEKATAGRTDDGFSWQTGLFVIYIAVVLLMLYRLAKSIRALWLLKAAGELRREGAFSYIHCDVKQPFSFFKWVFFDRKRIEDVPSSIVLNHEKIHGKHYHSLDVIIFELVKCILWFHPLAHMLSKQSRLINEYFTDAKVKERSGFHMYTTTLLTHAGIPVGPSIANHFAHVPLKARIVQLTKQPTSTTNRYYYLLYLPLISLFFLLFSCNLDSSIAPAGEVKTVTARFHDEYGDQQSREGEIMMQKQFGGTGKDKFSAIEGLTFIPFGEGDQPNQAPKRVGAYSTREAQKYALCFLRCTI